MLHLGLHAGDTLSAVPLEVLLSIKMYVLQSFYMKGNGIQGSSAYIGHSDGLYRNNNRDQGLHVFVGKSPRRHDSFWLGLSLPL